MIAILAPLLFMLAQPPIQPQAQPPVPQAFTYRFEEVKRSVLRWPGGDQAQERKVAKGDQALTGDGVKTGWWGQALLSVPERQARFEVYANTQVKLAGGEPGVLLVLTQGRIKAFFQHLTEGAPAERRVAVPGALLAVRGTRYGVEVDSEGKSTLVVFEGVVEVLRPGPGLEPVQVRAGQWTTFGPGRAPKVEAIPARGFGERAWGQGLRPEGPANANALAVLGTLPGRGLGLGRSHR
ncbi:MAG: FecR domain-containing protein [Acidobacteria bacterium]|nr:FecR domain-containing protein [Acidobacteriota bacterium]MBI3488332.1 FecR domain-containing protein [Acidobacteriota bacterium]